MLVNFNIHKDVVLQEPAEVSFYVNLWSLCFEEAEPDNSPQFIKYYRHVGTEYIPGGFNKMKFMKLEFLLIPRRW